MIDWSPAWAPHILGKYDERTFTDDGLPEEQKVIVFCTVCKTTWKTTCTSGSVRQHIQRFAYIHQHNDPFEVAKKAE